MKADNAFPALDNDFNEEGEDDMADVPNGEIGSQDNN